MKTKIKKVSSAKGITQRMEGIGTFRVTGPCEITGERVTIEFTGTREEAEKVRLISKQDVRGMLFPGKR